MIDIPFYLFAKHLHMGMFWFGIYLWMYWDKQCIQEKKYDQTLYTTKEIDWFGIKDNIKIEGYNLKFYEWWKNSIFLIRF